MKELKNTPEYKQFTVNGKSVNKWVKPAELHEYDEDGKLKRSVKYKAI